MSRPERQAALALDTRISRTAGYRPRNAAVCRKETAEGSGPGVAQAPEREHRDIVAVLLERRQLPSRVSWRSTVSGAVAWLERAIVSSAVSSRSRRAAMSLKVPSIGVGDRVYDRDRPARFKDHFSAVVDPERLPGV